MNKDIEGVKDPLMALRPRIDQHGQDRDEMMKERGEGAIARFGRSRPHAVL